MNLEFLSRKSISNSISYHVPRAPKLATEAKMARYGALGSALFTPKNFRQAYLLCSHFFLCDADQSQEMVHISRIYLKKIKKATEKHEGTDVTCKDAVLYVTLWACWYYLHQYSFLHPWPDKSDPVLRRL